MDKYQEIALSDLVVSDINVRKQLTGDDDETNIQDLADDIKINGLINPITVRRKNDNLYEVIAGQRRFMAARLCGYDTIACHILTVDNQKAEEISLIENVQRNAMTSIDKIRAYNKLYSFYENDEKKVCDVVHISASTLNKYIRLRDLPEKIINGLDAKGNDKISIDVALQLAALPKNFDTEYFFRNSAELNNPQKTDVLKKLNRISVEGQPINEEKIKETIEQIIQERHHLVSLPPPYVYDKRGNRVVIPQNLYDRVIEIIEKSKTEDFYIKNKKHEDEKCEDEKHEDEKCENEKHEDEKHEDEKCENEKHEDEKHEDEKCEDENNHICFLDIETNGRGIIVQIAYEIYDHNMEHKKSNNIIINNNGITGWHFKFTPEFIRTNGVDPVDAFKYCQRDLITCKHIVCHNISFDIPQMLAYFKKFGYNLAVPQDRFCTMRETTKMVGIRNNKGYKWPTLSELYAKCYGGVPDNELLHKADGDVSILRDSFIYLYKNGMIRIDEKIEFLDFTVGIDQKAS